MVKINKRNRKMKRLLYVTMLLVALVLIVSGCIEPSDDVQPEPEAALTVLVQGSPIDGAGGIIVGSKDQLHIASVVGREIVVMDPETGEILDRLGPDVGVEGPEDLIFGHDGSLYWTSFLTGEVGRLSPDGVCTSQFVAPGVNSITFSDGGRLFVALDFMGDALYELDPNLVDPPRLIEEDLGFLDGMDFGPDGFMYGPIWTKGEVVRVDVDNGTITTVADGMGCPAAVKFDSMGRLHVTDYTNGEILRVDVETGRKEVIARLPSGLDSLAFDSHDRLFVSHGQDGTIFEVLADGTTRTVSPGGMITAGSGVAVLPRSDGESVFVADLFTLREFNWLTGEERSVERHYIGMPGITSPETVSPDGDNLVLSSVFSNTVQVWSPETREVLEEYTDFAVPINAIRFQGDLIVVELGFEAGTCRVTRASDEGRVILADSADGLIVPVGLAATDDDLWVSDWATGMVQQIIADGEPLSEPIPVATNLSAPEGLAVAPDGSLLVVETGAGRLSSIDLETGEVKTVAEGLLLGAEGAEGYPPTWIFNGVAVGPSGVIYITGDIANVLYRIEPCT
jgi:sugar lactone lactonase YvrE